MRDVLPGEAAELQAIEGTLRRRFAAYGYGEVRTPALEFADTFERADDDLLTAGYRLFDEEGRALILRTDLTLPTVRLAASRLKDKPVPQRFYYVASSFRLPAAHRGQDGEFGQAGVELLGLDTPEADAECVTVLCDALGATGLKGYRVALGTVVFHGALIESLGLPGEDAEAVLEALADHDYPLLEAILSNADIADDVRRGLQRTLELSGTDAVLGQAHKLAVNEAMERAVDRLQTVAELVEKAGFEDIVTFDFGLFPDLGYYSGLVFEAFAPGVGFPLASGGRYDGVAAKFGWDVPAVGFAIGLDRLHVALAEAGVEVPVAAPALAFAGGLEEPALTAELRAAGLDVIALPKGLRPPPPSLRRAGGRFVLELAEGAGTEGSWRDVTRALRVG
jgi:ATP phosphoribosyltransferase regulatory subunit